MKGLSKSTKLLNNTSNKNSSISIININKFTLRSTRFSFLNNLQSSNFCFNNLKAYSNIKNFYFNCKKSFSLDNSPYSFVEDMKKLSKSYPFSGFYLSSSEAYTLNEIDRNLLLLKSNNVPEQAKRKFMIDLFDKMCKIKKLFPYLKGIPIFIEYFLANLDKFTKIEFLYVFSNLDKLKIFSNAIKTSSYDDNENTNTLYTVCNNNDITAREKFYDILSEHLLSDKIKASSAEILSVIDQFSMGNYTNKNFWEKIFNIIYEEESNHYNINNLVQLMYNISMSKPELISESSNSSKVLKTINKIFSYYSKDNNNNDKSNILSELPRVLEIIYQINLHTNQEVYKFIKNNIESYVFNFYEQNYVDKNRSKINNSQSNNQSNNFINNPKVINIKENNNHTFMILYKYIQYFTLNNFQIENINNKDALTYNKENLCFNELILYLLTDIDYSNLNMLNKIYFNFILLNLKSLLILINSIKDDLGKNNENLIILNTIVNKYCKDLNIRANNDLLLDEVLNDRKNYNSYELEKSEKYILQSLKYYTDIRKNSLREKIFYDIDYFTANKLLLGLDNFNIRNSILTYC